MAAVFHGASLEVERRGKVGNRLASGAGAAPAPVAAPAPAGAAQAVPVRAPKTPARV